MSAELVNKIHADVAQAARPAAVARFFTTNMLSSASIFRRRSSGALVESDLKHWTRSSTRSVPNRMMGWMAPLRIDVPNWCFSRITRNMEPSMSEITTIGLDLAKHVFPSSRH